MEVDNYLAVKPASYSSLCNVEDLNGAISVKRRVHSSERGPCSVVQPKRRFHDRQTWYVMTVLTAAALGTYLKVCSQSTKHKRNLSSLILYLMTFLGFVTT